jgi:hypothetical protein
MVTKCLQKVEGSQLVWCLSWWLQVYFQHSLVFVFVFVFELLLWFSLFFVFPAALGDRMQFVLLLRQV